jgi:acyl-homoserine-lactone acylase
VRLCALARVRAPPRAPAAPPAAGDRQRLCRRVTITRDDWGSPMSAAERRRRRVRRDLRPGRGRFSPRRGQSADRLGRTAEAEGESAVWQDLRQRLWIDPQLQADYRRSPAWLAR